MKIDYERLLEHPRVKGALTEKMRSECHEDEDLLPNKISEEAENVFTLGWDGDFPGGSGAIWITKWNDLYFLASSDYDPEGPFDSLEEVLEDERFHVGNPQPELTCHVLPLKRVLKIATDLVTEEGDRAFINDKEYVLTKGKLVPA